MFLTYLESAGCLAGNLTLSKPPSTAAIARARWSEQVGQGNENALGELILYNLPSSLSWQVQLLTLADSAPYVAHAFPTTNSLDWYSQENLQATMGDAEIALIRRFQPCLNSIQNLTPTPLPDNIIDPSKFSAVPPHPHPRSYLRQLLAA